MGEIINEINMVKPFWLWSFWAMIIGFIAMAVFIPDQPGGATVSLVLVAMMLLLVIPDMKAKYGAEGIKLTFGIKGIWRKKIPKDEIKRISIVEFNPMKDFGGWGIKYGRGDFAKVLMWAMPTKQPRGILVETVKGRKFLIGDEDPKTTLTLLASIYPVEV